MIVKFCKIPHQKETDTNNLKHKEELLDLINKSGVEKQLILKGFCNNIYEIL